MFKSARRNKTEGAVDRLAGRVLEVVGKVTGRKSHKAKRESCPSAREHEKEAGTGQEDGTTVSVA